jgi:hypothetical protein
MNRKPLSLLLVGAGAAAFVMVCLSHMQAEDPKPAQEKLGLVQAAEGALRATQAEYQSGQASAEDVYTWSRRLMEEELKHGTNQNAARDHVTRMRHLAEQAEALFKQGARGGSERKFQATLYYHLKAQAEALMPVA